MKKPICLLLCIILLSGCSQESVPTEVSLNEFLLQKSVPLAKEIGELAQSKNVISTFTADPKIEKNIDNMAAGIHGEPDSAIILKIASDAADTIQQLYGGDLEMSEQEKIYLKEKMQYKQSVAVRNVCLASSFG